MKRILIAEDDAATSSLFELTLRPISRDAALVHQTSLQLFQAITTLISLHPIDPNSELDAPDPECGGMWFGGDEPIMMMTGGDENDDDSAHDDSNDDDDLVIADPRVVVVTTGCEAAEDERDAMLQRLDNLLIVPPELEYDDQYCSGQFDDADDDDSDNELL